MATKANLVIDQGSTFSTDLVLTDDNGDLLELSGYSAASQIRKWYSSTNSVSFAATINSQEASINLFLSSNQTNSLTAGRYVYDVEINDGSTILRVVEGIITVTPNVTR